MSGERNFLSLGDKRSVCADLLGVCRLSTNPCVVTMRVSAPFYQLLMKRVGSVTMNGSRKSGKFFHFSVLGWTQEEIGEGFSIAQQTVSDVLTGNGHLADFGKLLGPNWNEKGLQQVHGFRLGTNCPQALLCVTVKEITELVDNLSTSSDSNMTVYETRERQVKSDLDAAK